jgi:Uma2 family endonuclease
MSIASHNQNVNTADSVPLPRSRRGDWTWELVTMFPQQGEWTEEEYLAREFDGLVEYCDGVLEFLPLPTWSHQYMVDFLHSLLKQFVQPRSLGYTAFAPLRVRVRRGKYREPDVLFVTPTRFRGLNQPAEGADLVMEIISGTEEDRERDLVEKRADYAAAGIPEYWIVDPETQTFTVLSLKGNEYRQHGEFGPGTSATSILLPGFEVDVSSAFAAANPAR